MGDFNYPNIKWDSESTESNTVEGKLFIENIRDNFLFQHITKGPATRNDFVNDIVHDARADAIFATLKTIVDDGSSTISSTISLRVAGP